jgi:hypothetical protein
MIYEYQHLSLIHSSILRYDNHAKDLTKEGMRRGIQQAAAFLVSIAAAISIGSKCNNYN